jgi:nucleotide sugar dehydrogenase
MKDQGIFKLDETELLDEVNQGHIKFAVIGLGRIGLPTASMIAKSKIPTVGIDININLVEKINQGKVLVNDEPGLEEILNEVIKNEFLKATSELEEGIKNADVIVCCLPTPIKKESNSTNYEFLIKGFKSISKVMKKNVLIIIESTVGPNVIEKQIIPTIEQISGFRAGIEFGIVSCPERANPFTIIKDFDKIPRVIGGINKKSTRIAEIIYNKVFNTDIVTVSDCKTANAVKVVENVFRDVNVAFMNEIAIYCDKLGIDVIELLDACKTKYNFLPHYPGIGVGGPCLPVNPYQLFDHFPNNDSLEIVKIARKINSEMPNYTIKVLLDTINEIGKKINECQITILGVSYKPNVKDIQHSPIKIIVKYFEENNIKIKIYDPLFKDENVFSIKCEKNILDSIDNSDAIILCTAHDEFFDFNFSSIVKKMKKLPIFIDGRNMLTIKKINDLGMRYKGIGRSQLI